MKLGHRRCDYALAALLLGLTSACGETRSHSPAAANGGDAPTGGAGGGATAGAGGGATAGAGGGATAGAGGGTTAGAAGYVGQGGAATTNPDVIASVNSFCGALWTLRTGSFAPPTKQGRWGAVAAFASFASTSAPMGGRHRFYSGSYILEVDAQAWSGVPFCGGDGPFVPIAVDDESTVSWSAGALSPSGPIHINAEVVLEDVARGETMAFSGSTLLVGSNVYAQVDGVWGNLTFPLVWESTKVVSLGSDRFARLDQDATQVVRRDGMDWVSMAMLPPADSVAMTEDDALIALGAGAGTAVYHSDAGLWVVEKTFTEGSQPSLTKSSIGYILALSAADGVHVFDSSAAWSEVDLVPLNGVALVRGDLLLVQTSESEQLMRLPTQVDRFPSSLTVIYSDSR